MLKIKITNLQDGEHEYDFAVTAKELDLEDIEISGEILIKVKLYKSGNQFDVKADIKGKLNLECDRCLDKYAEDFTNSFEMIYKFDFNNEFENPEDERDEIVYINPNTAYIDLKDDIRDFIVLSVPMKHVPEEIDGICSLCKRPVSEILKIERQEEINPVWEKLIKTKSK